MFTALSRNSYMSLIEALLITSLMPYSSSVPMVVLVLGMLNGHSGIRMALKALENM